MTTPRDPSIPRDSLIGRLGPAITLLLACLVLQGSPALAQADSFRVVVHESNPVESLARSQVSDFFLKKEERWPNSYTVKPVDQSSQSAVRAGFSEAVLGRKVKSVESYWQKLIFSGMKMRPFLVGSDQEVLEFVRHNVGAIGYVSNRTALGEGVKALQLTD